MEDETYEENIRKEAQEEIGLTGISFNIGPKILVQLPNEGIYIQWFVAVLDRESHSFRPAKSEVAELRWMDRDRFQTHSEAHPELYVPSVPIWKHLWE
jgi:8-oxo-dGTP pyrophosphatase MutT (NUDIX family)